MHKTSSDIAVRMTDRERSLFEQTVENSHRYLEFGCGGSTEIALALGCKRIVSVDSDLEWIKTVLAKPLISDAVAKKIVFFEYVDIGPVGKWGKPRDESKIRNWPHYFLVPFTKFDYSYNYILIDGRFRTACAYASYAFMAEDTLLAVHDYTVRKSYYDIEKFFDLQEEADTLAIFKKKPKVVMQSLYMSILGSLFDP